MPATQNYRLADWHESPFLGSTHDLESAPDTRVFDPESAADVAQCLLESDTAIDAYRWVLSEKQIEELALDSANTIIVARRQLKLERELQDEFETAKKKRDTETNGKKLGVVVSLVQNLATGESAISHGTMPLSRVNA